MYIKGNTDSFRAEAAGSGELKATDLKAWSVSTRISGSAVAYVYAKEKLDAGISGSGTVYYDGKPQEVKKRIAGSGRLKELWD